MTLSLTIKTLFNSNISNEMLMLKYSENGDSTYLARLYDNCSDDLYHFLLTLTDAEFAKDITQKTWLKVIEKGHLYSANGRFIAWLFTLARNTLIDELRVKQPETLDDHKPIPSKSADVYISLCIEQAFDGALNALSFEQREAFILQQEGFGLQEIAEITSIPLETVRSRLRFAKQNLRKRLDSYHD